MIFFHYVYQQKNKYNLYHIISKLLNGLLSTKYKHKPVYSKNNCDIIKSTYFIYYTVCY